MRASFLSPRRSEAPEGSGLLTLESVSQSTSCHCQPPVVWVDLEGKRAWKVCAFAAEQLRAERRLLGARRAVSEDHVQNTGPVLWLCLLGESKRLEIFDDAKHAFGVYYLVINRSFDFGI